jgi:hypothetical protein
MFGFVQDFDLFDKIDHIMLHQTNSDFPIHHLTPFLKTVLNGHPMFGLCHDFHFFDKINSAMLHQTNSAFPIHHLTLLLQTVLNGHPMFGLVQDFDLFDKTDRDELQERSKIGSLFTFLTFLFSFFGFSLHIFRIFRPQVYRELLINPSFTNQQELINVSLSVEVSLPCYFLHVDSLDLLGFSQLNINTTITLRRLNVNGTIIGVSNSTFSDFCMPCYGLLPDNQCCNSCEQLILLSMFANRQPTPERWVQCGNAPRIPSDISVDEKCLVKGKITINKTPGGFHIAAGRNVKGPGHQHDLSFSFPDFSFRHKIERIRFGVKLSMIDSPLTNVVHKERSSGPAQYEYRLRVTPVTLHKNGKYYEKGYEYNALQSKRQGIPGLFFRYEFSPYTVAVHIRSRSIIQEAASLAGFLAGIWALISTAHRVLTGFVEKKE